MIQHNQINSDGTKSVLPILSLIAEKGLSLTYCFRHAEFNLYKYIYSLVVITKRSNPLDDDIVSKIDPLRLAARTPP